MAYGMLIQNKYGQMPEYGLLHYSDKDFRVNFTSELERQLLNTLEEIRLIEKQNEAPTRSHNSSTRCRSCGYRGICDQKIN
jgi:CRISPR/Cas system-associated exonuclease Cas4 (RecB family)